MLRSERAAGTALRVVLACSLAAVLTGCPGSTPTPGRAVVQARVVGVTGAHRPAPDVVLELVHAQDVRGPRTRYLRDVPIQDVRSLRLLMTEAAGLPFTEEWHLLHLSRVGQRPGADPVVVEHTGDPGWVRSHTGNLAWLTARRTDLSLPSDSFSAFAPASIRPGGTTVLSRVEDDDPVLPWASTDCTPAAVLPLAVTLRPAAPGVTDCFDMQTLASLLLGHLAVVVSDAAQDRGARARSHSLAVVPHVATAVSTDPAALPAPGIGFVYRTELEPAPGGVGTAPITGSLTLAVPLTLVFSRAAPGGTLAVSIDPIDPVLPGGAASRNAERVTVLAEQGSVSNLFADTLRAGVVDALGSARVPTPAGVPISEFLGLLFGLTVVSDSVRVPDDFSVLALPADRTVPGTPDTVAVRLGELTVDTDSGVTPALPGGIGARDVRAVGGGVEVSVNRNAAGTTVRRFRLPAPQDGLPFTLTVQR